MSLLLPFLLPPCDEPLLELEPPSLPGNESSMPLSLEPDLGDLELPLPLPLPLPGLLLLPVLPLLLLEEDGELTVFDL